MATGMHMDERSVDCLVLGHHDQDRKVSAKSVTMRAMTLCKNLSGYRELLLRHELFQNASDVNTNFESMSDSEILIFLMKTDILQTKIVSTLLQMNRRRRSTVIH